MQRRTTKLSCGSAYGNNADENCAELESVITKHDRYLIELEKQKKLSKILRRKNAHEEEKEKKERGFSTYVNGANALPKPQSSIKFQTHSRSNEFRPNANFTSNSTRKKKGEGRNTTPRRFWGQESVEIVTDSGAKLYASLRTLNGKYSDDFEDSIDFEKTSVKPKGAAVEKIDMRPKSVPLTHRKFWGQGSVMVKVSSGENLRASVSNLTDYSMNFDEDFDDSLSETDEEIEEEIEVDLNGSNEVAENFFVLGSSSQAQQPTSISKSNGNT